jgi:hypothetical protein
VTTKEERDAAFAGARQAVQVHSDPDVGLDVGEIEVTPDDRPAPPPQAELAAAREARDEYLRSLEHAADIDAKVESGCRRELRDRFAVALAPAVYDKLYKLSRGGPVQPDDFARELWGAAEAAVKGRPPQ